MTMPYSVNMYSGAVDRKRLMRLSLNYTRLRPIGRMLCQHYMWPWINIQPTLGQYQPFVGYIYREMAGGGGVNSYTEMNADKITERNRYKTGHMYNITHRQIYPVPV